MITLQNPLFPIQSGYKGVLNTWAYSRNVFSKCFRTFTTEIHGHAKTVLDKSGKYLAEEKIQLFLVNRKLPQAILRPKSNKLSSHRIRRNQMNLFQSWEKKCSLSSPWRNGKDLNKPAKRGAITELMRWHQSTTKYDTEVHNPKHGHID